MNIFTTSLTKIQFTLRRSSIISQSIQLQPIMLFLLVAAIIVKDKVFAGGGFTGSRSVWFGEAQCVLHSGYGRRAGLVLR